MGCKFNLGVSVSVKWEGPSSFKSTKNSSLAPSVAFRYQNRAKRAVSKEGWRIPFFVVNDHEDGQSNGFWTNWEPWGLLFRWAILWQFALPSEDNENQYSGGLLHEPRSSYRVAPSIQYLTLKGPTQAPSSEFKARGFALKEGMPRQFRVEGKR